MKSSIGFIAIFVISLMTLAAQPGPGQGPRMTPEERAARQTSRMIGELNLDETQALAVEAINQKYAEKQSAFMQEHRGDREAMRSGMQELIAQKDEELKAILTGEQYARHQEMQAEQRERMQSRRPENR